MSQTCRVFSLLFSFRMIGRKRAAIHRSRHANLFNQKQCPWEYTGESGHENCSFPLITFTRIAVRASMVAIALARPGGEFSAGFLREICRDSKEFVPFRARRCENRQHVPGRLRFKSEDSCNVTFLRKSKESQILLLNFTSACLFVEGTSLMRDILKCAGLGF